MVHTDSLDAPAAAPSTVGLHLMRWGVLGPLLVRGDTGDDIRVPAGRRRTLLALLLMRANHPVPLDEIVDVLWDGAPPGDAARTVRVYMTRLRQVLGPSAAARLLTRSHGYQCHADEDELDLLRFERLCQQAGSASRERSWVRAAGLLTEALGLWRGAPLGDVPSELLRSRECQRLTQLRLQAVEDNIDARMHLHQYGQLIPQLRDLTEEEPLREHLHAQLVRALAGSGRRAEALETYRRVHRALVDQLGIEPGPELRDLHQRILTGDEEPPGVAEPVSVYRPAGGPVAPHQVPAAVRHFVGRTAELNLLTGLMGDTTATGAVVIAQIGGTAGIGKTTLALHWAHLNASRFPDGQLYVDLRGFDASSTPAAPAEVMHRFLAALDVPAHQIPADPDELTALYRSRLANRRMLVLLDNARDAEQVRPLLPGAPGCLVLVTSRDQLRGLVARDGAVPLTLELLTVAESRELLTRRLGHDRLAAHEHVIDELVRLCARLPLALNIVAANAALRPSHPLTSLVDELRGTRRRLDAFSTSDGTVNLRAVFSWSYRIFGRETARVFRLLGLHPGPDISLAAVASLTALGPERTRRALDELTAACLIHEPVPGRYTFHDLLRAYAAECSRDEDSGTEQRDAVRRLCSCYAHTAHGAMWHLAPHRPPVEYLAPPAGTLVHQVPDAAAALAWFDAEHANLLAAQRAAADHRWHPTVWQLAWDLTTFHARRGRRHDQLAVCRAALRAAAHLPVPHRLRAHRLVGIAYADLGHHEQAIDHLNQALALAVQQQNRTDQAHSHRQLAWAWGRQGNDRRAVQHSVRALALFRALDQPRWEASALNAAGWYLARRGNYDAARASCQSARRLYRKHPLRRGEADTLDSLGYIEYRTGDHCLAIAHYEEALTLYRSLADSHEVANVLDHLGHPYAALGQHQRASSTWRHALDLYCHQQRHQDAERVARQLDTLRSQPPVLTAGGEARSDAVADVSAGSTGLVGAPGDRDVLRVGGAVGSGDVSASTR